MLIPEFRRLFNRPMKIVTNHEIRRSLKLLGIETSCDDTAAAVLTENGSVLGESVRSQLRLMNKLGGVMPPIAQRQHQANIVPVVKEAMSKAGTSFEDLDAIAVTTRPDVSCLTLSLSVGANHALSLCREHNKPLVKVHHMRAHALTASLCFPDLKFPFLCILVSGGHCILAAVRGINDFLVFGTDTDGAPGESFDKVARRLKLRHLGPQFESISGGQAIEICASQGGNPLAFSLPDTLRQPTCNFSFSGIKTFATEKLIVEEEKNQNVSGGQWLTNLPDICASFQHAVFHQIAKRVQRGIELADHLEHMPSSEKQDNSGDSLRSLVISGGVAGNQYIRKGLTYVAREYDYRVLCPPPKLCSDNGVMIAWNGLLNFQQFLEGNTDCPDVLLPENLPVEGENIWTDYREAIGQDYREEINRIRWKIKRKIDLNDPGKFAFL